MNENVRADNADNIFLLTYLYTVHVVKMCSTVKRHLQNIMYKSE